MSGRKAAGPMPWSGSRARSRERGYGEAMRDVFLLMAKMHDKRAEICGSRPWQEHSVTPEIKADLAVMQTLEAIRSWAYNAWIINDEPAVTVRTLAGHLGSWDRVEAPAEG